MRTSTFARLGALALFGFLATQSTSAFAWGYGHGMLQVNPDTGNVSGIDVTPAANTQDGYNAGVKTNVQAAEQTQANTQAQTAATPVNAPAYGTAQTRTGYSATGNAGAAAAVLSR